VFHFTHMCFSFWLENEEEMTNLNALKQQRISSQDEVQHISDNVDSSKDDSPNVVSPMTVRLLCRFVK